MTDQKADTDEVTLVLRDERVKANKNKLIRYSLYFASLFSENYIDHRQEEFKINYEVSLTTLKDFVHWADNEAEHTRVVHSAKYHCIVRASLEKFITGNYAQLLELLELSVVFMAEKLTEYLVEIIIYKRYAPVKMLEIWLLAEELGLKVLRDVAFATCLDRFQELPLATLGKLSVEHFSKLVLNVNVRSSTARFLSVKKSWLKYNGNITDLPKPLSQFLNSDFDTIEPVLQQERRRYIQCTAGLDIEHRDVLVAAWNGRTLQTIAEMTESLLHKTFADNGKPMVGRQVTGRGFSIYLVGGEQGIGTGRFNPALWRYCLLSKKWYIVTLYPRPRRHMAVAFIGNKLYLFGGVGKNRLKLNTVDVYNVHTGTWTTAEDIPEEFTEVPPSFVVNNKFVYYKSRFHVYDPRTNHWSSSGTSSDGTNLLNDYQVPTRSIIGYRNDSKNRPVLFIADVVSDYRTSFLKRYVLDMTGSTINMNVIHQWKSRDGPSTLYKQIMNGRSLVSFFYGEKEVYIEVGEVRENEVPDDTENEDEVPVETYRRVKTYRKELNEDGPDKTILFRLGCFNLIDPKSLHTLVPLSNEESIDV